MSSPNDLMADSELAEPLPDILHAILDSVPDALAVVDVTTTAVLAANPPFRDLAGKACDDLAAFMRPDEAWRFRSFLLSGEDGGYTKPLETTLLDGGKACPMRWRLRDLRIEGRVVHLLSAVPLFNSTDDLAVAQRQLVDLVDGAALGVAVHSENRLLYCSSGYARLFGYDDISAFADAVASGHVLLPDEISAGAASEVETFETTLLRKDGAKIWLDIARRPVRWSGKRAIMVTAYDITRRKKIEIGLDKNEKLFRHLINSAPALIAFIDRDGCYEFVNEQLAALLGSTADRLQGTPAAAAGQGEPYSLNPDNLTLALSGQPVNFQSEIKLPEGRLLVYENHYLPRMIDAEADGIFMMAFDVSDRVKSANALRLSEERFRNMVDLIPYGIALIDLKGRLRLSNPAHDKMLGYAAGELHGRSIWDIFVAEEQDLQREIFFRAMRDKPQPLPNLGRCQRKDGRVIDVLFNWNYEYDENGLLMGFISILTDVTEELESKRDLQSAKDMAERANLEKSRFLAAASHDLQQPLHSLSIMLGLLSRQKGDMQRNEIITMMGRAVEGSRALLRVVLDISKLEAGVVVPCIEVFPIADILEQIEADLAPLLEGRPVAFHIIWSTAEVMSDRLLLKSILHNLVSNAIRYTEKGRILVGARKRGDKLQLQVWDTGRGIPEERLGDIFTEFTRLERGVGEDEIPGIGLGLSIVERSCYLLDHKIAVQSTLGKGSLFTVDVPLVTWNGEDMPKARVSSPVSYQSRRGLILLIEDNPTAALATRRLIEDWGHRCLVALCEDEALQIIRTENQQPDIIVADYDLAANETGIKVIDHIYAVLGRVIPAVLMTASESPECLESARERNIPVILKPASPARLRSFLSYCLASDEVDTEAD